METTTALLVFCGIVYFIGALLLTDSPIAGFTLILLGIASTILVPTIGCIKRK